MALRELRNLLPNGDPGRIINSYIFPEHIDVITETIKYRKEIKKFITDEHKNFIRTCSNFGKIRSYYRSNPLESCFDFFLEMPRWLEEFTDDDLTIMADQGYCRLSSGSL